MKRWIVAVLVLSGVTACIDWDDAQQTCDETGPCSKFNPGGGGGADSGVDAGDGDAGQDAGADAGAEDGGVDAGFDAGFICPGTPAMCRGAVCQESPSFPMVDFSDVHREGAAIIAVGDKGTVACFDGQRWNFDFSQPQETLQVVSGTRDDLLIAGGGYYRHLRNGAFVASSQGSCSETGVSAGWSGPGYAVIGGYGGMCEQFDGGAWRALSSSPADLTQIQGNSANDLWAVGSHGDILRRQDAGWQPFTGLTPTEGLYSVCVTPEVVRVGGEQNMWQIDPQTGGADASFVGEAIKMLACGDGEIWRTRNFTTEYCTSPESCTALPADFDSLHRAEWEAPGRVLVAGGAGRIGEFHGPDPVDYQSLGLPNLDFLQTFNAVADQGDRVVAVGNGCTVMNRGDAGWTDVSVTLCGNENLTAVTLLSDGGGFIAGKAGLLRYFDSNFAPSQTVIQTNVGGGTAIGDYVGFSSGPGALYAISNRELLKRVGALIFEVEARESGSSEFLSVLALNDGGVAVGTDVGVKLWDGQQLTAATGPTAAMTGLYEAPNGDLFAFGGTSAPDPDHGQVWRAAAGSTSFTETTFGPPSDLVQLQGSCSHGGTALVIAGSEVYRFNPTQTGGTLTAAGTPAGRPLHSITCTGSRFFAVGDNSTIISGPP